MNAATASEIARFETMTITKVVEKFKSLFGTSKPTPKVTFRSELGPERLSWRSIPKSA